MNINGCLPAKVKTSHISYLSVECFGAWRLLGVTFWMCDTISDPGACMQPDSIFSLNAQIRIGQLCHNNEKNLTSFNRDDYHDFVATAARLSLHKHEGTTTERQGDSSNWNVFKTSRRGVAAKNGCDVFY